MASSKKVVSPSEAAAALEETLARFRREGGQAEPVLMGAEGRPEAVVLPYEEYERLAAQRELAEAFASARGSVLAEVPGEFSPEFEADSAMALRGEITMEELERRTIDRWRRATE
ncbi:MAG: hypothetical protein J2P40_14810 [Candidatus Dormibacteraeota bacterium]|nr:hypothetical protein [Candidatus Dormibacteraeota bacterium]MBO0705191.1 hypothetical protein [Candidatus Dormibacteraeota bacterium]MBO0762543.1 hypothetical protein [Candidatus Dormibacteraeota bacterium]